MDVGAVEQRASAPGAVVFYLEPLVVLMMTQYWLRCYILGCSQGIYLNSKGRSWSGGQETRNVHCLLYVYVEYELCTDIVVFAWYMALVEPRNGGTKTLCKRLSPGKQAIMIFIDNVPTPFYTPRSSKILGRSFLTRIYMTTASLSNCRNFCPWNRVAVVAPDAAVFM